MDPIIGFGTTKDIWHTPDGVIYEFMANRWKRKRYKERKILLKFIYCP